MLKLFDPEEDSPKVQEKKIMNQKLDQVTEQCDHNYGNCIFACTHKMKFNMNIYIHWIIVAGLCNAIPLMIPSSLSADDLSATVFNLGHKLYNNYVDFWQKYNLLSVKTSLHCSPASIPCWYKLDHWSEFIITKFFLLIGVVSWTFQSTVLSNKEQGSLLRSIELQIWSVSLLAFLLACWILAQIEWYHKII